MRIYRKKIFSVSFICSISFWTFILLLLPANSENGKSFAAKRPAKIYQSLQWPGIFKKVQKQTLPNLQPLDTTQLKQGNWYAEAIQDIRESEYEIKFDAGSGAYASPNRSQNLRSFYSGKTFTLQPRKDSADTWKLKLSTKGIYAGDVLIYQPGEQALITQNGNSIQFNHQNNFITEYINSTAGIRQNFIIEKEPAVKSKTITVRLEANKDWFVNKVSAGEIHFAKKSPTGHSKKIIYNSLKAWDANNSELKASFSIADNTISIDVNTGNAEYPITIDPLSTGITGTPDWMGDDADLANAYSGTSVASAGDVNGDGYSDVIIGAYGYDDGANVDEGRAFLYYGSETGLSATPASTPDDANQANAYFGVSVASAGDVNGDGYSDVIIGASGYTDAGNVSEGRAFVYYGSAAGLSNFPDIVLDDANKPNAFFGISVACAGDVNGDGFSDVIVGAYGYDDGPNAIEGRAFVYHGSATGLSVVPNSTPDDADQAGARVGVCVAGAGDVNGDGYSDVIIGAHYYDDGSNTDEGRAFVYYGSPAGISASPGSILDDADQAGAAFGRSVACAGDVNGDGFSEVIIGAFQYDDGSNIDEGRAFVYYGSAAGLSASPNYIANDADQAGAFFGWQTAGAGDVNGDGFSDVIIGAHFYDDGANADEGRAFVYYGSAAGLGASPHSILDDGDQAGAYFGWSVSAAGDVNGDGYSDIIIGAPYYDDVANVDEGRVFVYHGSADGLSAAPILINNITQGQAGFGLCVNNAGDVNGDGYSDVIVSAPWYDDGAIDEGRAYVYYGSASGISVTANVILDEANQAGAFFGYACASAGDVNGDGYGDVVVGAYQYNGIGRAYIYFGSATGLSLTSNQVLDGTQAGECFGAAVSSAGDVNHDGYSDVVIGAYLYDDGANADEGRAFIYHGSAMGLNTVPARIVSDANQSSVGLGFSVSSAGDINGDGFSDIIIGAPGNDNAGNADQGAVFIYYGSCTGIPAPAGLMLTGASQSGAFFGYACAGAGDVNADGFCDVIVGSFGYNSLAGRAYVFYGTNTGLSVAPFILENNSTDSNNGDRMGYSVNSAGDINGDGYSDIIVGIDEFNDPRSNPPQGRAFVYLGSMAGVPATPEIIITDNVNNRQFFGHSVASAGDVNGDGLSDIVVGGDHGSWPGFGMSWIYYGNDNGGLRNNLRLYNADLVTPMQQSNITDPSQFGAGLFSKSFFGRQKGKLVWQTINNGNSFPGSPVTNSTFYTSQQTSFTDLGLNGVELKTLVTKTAAPGNTYTRVRIKYDPATAITGQVYGPWRYPEGWLRGKSSIADVAMNTPSARLGNDATVCFVVPYTINATTSNATGYTWQNGATDPIFTATVPGLYWVDIALGGCTFRDSIMLSGLVSVSVALNPIICQDQTYTAASGQTFNSTGIYKDTLKSVNGCDSVISTIHLDVLAVTALTSNEVICTGQTYTLPWGTVVSIAGTYRDTLRYTTGCDSVWRTINLSVQSATSIIANPVICAGQTYTLPWGTVVNSTGTYRDTLHYTTGCDSIRRVVNLIVQAPLIVTSDPTICAGQSYTLPWGIAVNTPGVYMDTLHYASGCDSARRTVNLTILTATVETVNPVICEGSGYALPGGTVVYTTGTYNDTLHSVFGCDSVRRTVNLVIQSSTSFANDTAICAGQTYTLPWGTVVNTTGVYRDTLHYTTGCDSIRRTVNLIVQQSIVQTTNPVICAVQTFTLPWGTIVNATGVYRDTLHYTTGCDSVWRTVNLTIQSPTSQTINPVICSGQTYTLPWGTVVNTTGVYRDTLHYTATGCDSLRRTVNLIVQSSALQINNSSICTGQTYTLPWGTIVNSAGVYRDTLRYTTGCDSVRRIVNLTVQSPTSVTTNPTICAGQTYTLPWGTVVNTAGVYRDTLHYSSGCDSLRRTVNLAIQVVSSATANPIICGGQSYTLPWGEVVNTSGVYRDTLLYTTGCDSIRRIVNLIVQSPALVVTNPVICQGASYTLPWGAVVNTAGTYRDTLHYTTGCDSVRRIVNLRVTAAAVSVSTATICSYETFTLPWGVLTNVAGVYKDTARTAVGCDSLIRTVNLRVDPAPSVSVTKSNDVDCVLGIAKLEATGGMRYTWTPSGTLNNATIYNPVASPAATTWYKVLVTSDKGCTTEDSVQVKVIAGDIANGYLVPNAFTPNGDGNNDCFGVRTWGAVKNLRLQVYSRWGEIVFSTTDSSKCWDGTYKGAQQPTGVFVYQVWAETICGKVYRSGTVTLIR